MVLTAPEFAYFDFIVASLLMGLGIGSDVAIATIARASQLSNLRLAIIWIVGVSFTHTVFPMVGYLITYFSIQVQPSIEPIVGLLAFGFIFFYLKGELTDFLSPKDKTEDRQILVTLGLILAVSWDALWSGPAKSAQVIGWPEIFVWASFIVVGLLVSTLALTSLGFALKVKNLMHMNRLTHSFVHWVQYTIIGYFGLLALLNYTFGIQLFWWQVLLMSGTVIAAFMTKNESQLIFNQTNK